MQFLVLSSRYLKDSEKAESLKETILAIDGIAIIVHTDNAVADLTVEQISAIKPDERFDPHRKITGEVAYNGQNIFEADVNNLRKEVGMVFPKPNPFPI